MTAGSPPSSPPPPPRAFAQGTGLLLQTVGVIMFLTSCCICSGGWLVDPAREPAEVAQALEDNPNLLDEHAAYRDQPGRVGVVLLIMFSTVGGLALAVFGLGLQSEKRGAAWGAVITACALLLVLAIAGVLLWTNESGLGFRIYHGLLSVVTLAIAGFCIAALRAVYQYPPPAGYDVLSPQELAELGLDPDAPADQRNLGLAQELAQKRAKLAQKQHEIEELERKLQRRRSDRDDAGTLE